MKKLIGIILLSFLLLTGCETQFKYLENALYVDKVIAKDNTILIFETEDGKTRNLYWEHGKGTPLSEGEKYRVKYTVEDNWTLGDCIAEVEKVE